MNAVYARFWGTTLALAILIGVGAGSNAFAQSTSSASSPYCTPITPGLYRGVQGAHVVALQQYLASQGFFHGSATGFFGPLTYGALVAFQASNGLPPTGYFGPMTHAVYQKRCESQPMPLPIPQPSGVVSIHSITPTVGPIGTEVTITGNNFTNDNTIHFGGGVIMRVPVFSTTDIQCITYPCDPIQTLKFMVPQGHDPACFYSNPRCLMASPQTMPGNYQVYVKNANGTSNSMPFTVTGATTVSRNKENVH